VILRLRLTRRIRVGRLGVVSFLDGWHLYAGSAMACLSARIGRHLRRRKKLHWHIDYLRERADEVAAFPMPSSRRRECELAGALAKIFPAGPQGFGCSDCACPTHLYHSADDPRRLRAFHLLLERFRAEPPITFTQGRRPGLRRE